MNDEIRKRIDAVRRGEVPEGYIVENHQLRPLDWKYEKIGKYLVAHDEYSNDTGRYMLATSSRQGLLPQTDYYNDQRFDETVGGFHIVPEGYVTYRHMSDDDVFKFNVNDLGTPVLVSPEYPVFTTNAELNQSLLIEYLNGTNEFRSFCRAQKKGSTRTRMYFSRLGEFMMPIPPISEQQKIADILAACDRLIALKQNRLEELKQLKRTCLAKMFPREGENVPELRFPGFTARWEQRKLSDIGEVITGSTPSTQHPEYYSEDGIPWVTPTDITENVISDTPRKLSAMGARVGRVVPAETILVTCIASIGKNTMLANTGSFNQQINGLVPDKKKFDPYFLLTESFHWSAKMKREAAAGTMQIVNKNEFSAIETYVPELLEQKAIGAYFRQLDTLITLHQRELEAEQQKKKALMRLLLAGLVRVPG